MDNIKKHFQEYEIFDYLRLLVFVVLLEQH